MYNLLSKSMRTVRHLCCIVQQSYSASCSNHLGIAAVSKSLFSTKVASEMSRPTCSKKFDPAVDINVNTPLFQSLFTDGLKTVQKLFQKNNYELRLCGGAVRDLLMDKKPNDIDLATVATPDQMLSMFEKEGIRIISANGIAHGTVTCRVSEQNIEITTLRIDEVTDGRHAKVVFTDDWFLDASRRDLTFNAMFLTLDGKLIDFFNGKDDLENCKVRFVGDADTRIKEDYLRILRYFRFFGRIANNDTEHDSETLRYIAENSHGLAGISGERLWVELKLILGGKFVFESFKFMHQCGLFPYLGLPSGFNSELLYNMCKHSAHLNMHYITPLAALFDTIEDVEICFQRLKLSKAENNILMFIVINKWNLPKGDDRFSNYIDMVLCGPRHQQEMIVYLFELLKFAGDVEALDYFTNFRIPTFPLSGGEVKAHGQLKGQQITLAVNTLFAKWKESRYTLTRQQLLDSFSPETNWADLEKLHPHKETKFPPKKRKR